MTFGGKEKKRKGWGHVYLYRGFCGTGDAEWQPVCCTVRFWQEIRVEVILILVLEKLLIHTEKSNSNG